MTSKITMMSEVFEQEQTGEKVEGITIIVDGVFKQFLDIIKGGKPEYETNMALIQNALFLGLEAIKSDIKNKANT